MPFPTINLDSGMLSIFIKDIAIPEIMAVVRAHQNAGLPPPTNEQILAATDLGEARIIGIGESFLQSLPSSLPAAQGGSQAAQEQETAAPAHEAAPAHQPDLGPGGASSGGVRF